MSVTGGPQSRNGCSTFAPTSTLPVYTPPIATTGAPGASSWDKWCRRGGDQERSRGELLRRRSLELAPDLERLPRPDRRVKDQFGQDDASWMDLELERRDDAEIPAPPRMAQKRSSSSLPLAWRRRPSAVMTSTEIRLSQARPCLRTSQPSSPPNVSPATPVVETNPPCSRQPEVLEVVVHLAQVSPGSPWTVRAPPGSMRLPFVAERSIVMPPSHCALPVTW